MSTVILVPRRPDNGHRDTLWAYAKPTWAELGFPIVEGDDLDGPFNRSAALNRASALAGKWDTAILLDSDVLVNSKQVLDAIELSKTMERVVFPFRTYQALNAGMTTHIMEGFKGNWAKGLRATFYDNKSACVVVPRKVWDAVGGFDERFIGWGWEDVAFSLVTSSYAGNFMRIPGDLWHLHHHRSPENNHASPLFIANRDLCHRYLESRGSWTTTQTILSEAGGPLS